MAEQVKTKTELLKIPLKIYEPSDRDESQIIVMNQRQKLGELLTAIKSRANDKFCGDEFKETPDNDIRLRKYTPKMKLKETVYGEGRDGGDDGEHDFASRMPF